MGKNKEGVEQPNLINSKDYINNYSEINWGGDKDLKDIYCFDCNTLLDKKNIEEHPELYIKYEDGQYSHKECNFN